MNFNNFLESILEFIYHTIKILLGPLVNFIWIKKVEGIENIPKRGSIIIAFNHQSYFDFLCFVAVCPRHVHYLAAEKFFESKFWYPLMILMGQIRVDRKNKNKAEMHSHVYQHIHNGKVIGIFPEGTRSPHEDLMLKAFNGVAKYAIHGDVDIIPVGIKGAHSVMSRFDKLPKFKKNIEFYIGEPIKLRHKKTPNLTEKDFEYMTHEVMLKISELSGKKYPHLIN